jgi:hypothetical protein
MYAGLASRTGEANSTPVRTGPPRAHGAVTKLLRLAERIYTLPSRR